MNETSAAIQYAIEVTDFPAHSGETLIVMPQDTRLSGLFPEADVWHPFADASSSWTQKGHHVLSDLEPAAAAYKTVLIYAPRQKEETLYLLAKAASLTQENGTILIAAPNLAGGQSLAKQAKSLGFDVDQLAKHKCKVVWTRQPRINNKHAIEKAVEGGQAQCRTDGNWSQPGLFSWKQQDKGTNVLLHHLPFSLSGIGADFGCGTGTIGQKLMQRYAAITKLINIDLDARAIECCQKNLAQWRDRCDFMWADVRKLPQLPPLDFIVTNPPFHQGRTEAIALGQGFISAAAERLKPGGMLVFVANVHLPYESLLPQHFSLHRVASEQDGFKVIEAVR